MDDGAPEDTFMPSGDTITPQTGTSMEDEGAPQPDEVVQPTSAGAAEDDQQKERVPIVWTGRPKEPPAAAASTAGNAANAMDGAAAQESLQRLKPNAGFLLNLVADAERGNKRKCAEEATQVSLNVLGQAVSAGMRPQLARIGPDAGDAAVRRVVLSVAQQQRLAACSALLREVAATFGFTLHVAPDVGDEDAGECEGATATAPSGEGAADGSGTAGLPSGVSGAERECPGFPAQQLLRVQLNLASRKERQEVDKAVSAPSSDDDAAERAPKPRAPGINMAASRLAGAALGAIGVPVPEKQAALSKPSPSQTLQKLSAMGDGRAGLFALELPADDMEVAGGEEASEELDELDDEGDDISDDDFKDAASAGHSADESQPFIDKQEPRPASERGSAYSSRLLRQLGASRTPTPIGNSPSSTPVSASRFGLPRPNSSAMARGALRMDTLEPEGPEQKSNNCRDEDAPPGKRPRISARASLQAASAGMQQGETPVPGAADGRQPKKAAAEPAADMARLLSRASAAAGAPKRWPARDAAAASDGGRERRSDVGKAVRDGSASEDGGGPTRAGGAAPNGHKLGLRRSGRGAVAQGPTEAGGIYGRGRRQNRSERDEEIEAQIEAEHDSVEEKGTGGGKNGARGGRGLFGAAMAGLHNR